MHRGRGLLLLGLVAAQAGHAHAAPFVTLPREDGSSHGGLDMSLLPVVDTDGNDRLGVRVDPFAEINLRADLTVFGHLPAMYLRGANDTTTSLGTLELGVGYAPPLDGGNARVLVTAALGLPTAATSIAGRYANLVGATARITDLVNASADNLVMRLQATVRSQRGGLLTQAGLGLDAGIATAGSDSDAVGPTVRASGGLATELGPVRVGGELTLLFGTAPSTDGDTTLGSLAASVSSQRGAWTPFAALVVPLDDELRAIASVAFTFGVEYR